MFTMFDNLFLFFLWFVGENEGKNDKKWKKKTAKNGGENTFSSQKREPVGIFFMIFSVIANKGILNMFMSFFVV